MAGGHLAGELCRRGIRRLQLPPGFEGVQGVGVGATDRVRRSWSPGGAARWFPARWVASGQHRRRGVGGGIERRDRARGGRPEPAEEPDRDGRDRHQEQEPHDAGEPTTAPVGIGAVGGGAAGPLAAATDPLQQVFGALGVEVGPLEGPEDRTQELGHRPGQRSDDGAAHRRDPARQPVDAARGEDGHDRDRAEPDRQPAAVTDPRRSVNRPLVGPHHHGAARQRCREEHRDHQDERGTPAPLDAARRQGLESHDDAPDPQGDGVGLTPIAQAQRGHAEGHGDAHEHRGHRGLHRAPTDRQADDHRTGDAGRAGELGSTNAPRGQRRTHEHDRERRHEHRQGQADHAGAVQQQMHHHRDHRGLGGRGEQQRQRASTRVHEASLFMKPASS